jgi:hypothetical protein
MSTLQNEQVALIIRPFARGWPCPAPPSPRPSCADPRRRLRCAPALCKAVQIGAEARILVPCPFSALCLIPTEAPKGRWAGASPSQALTCAHAARPQTSGPIVVLGPERGLPYPEGSTYRGQLARPHPDRCTALHSSLAAPV